MKSLLKYIDEFNNDLDPEEPLFQHELVNLIRELHNSDSGEEGFALNEVFEVMEQITESTEIFKSSALLVKRHRDTERGNVKCHGCEGFGHFAIDNPSCSRKMKKNNEEFRRRKAEEYKKIKHEEHKKMGEGRKTADGHNENDRTTPEQRTEYEPESDDEIPNKKENKDNADETPKKKSKSLSFFR